MFSDRSSIIKRGCADVDAPLWSWLFHATGNEARASELYADILATAGREIPWHVWREGGSSLVREVLRLAERTHRLSEARGVSLSDSALGRAGSAREKVLAGLQRMSGELCAVLLLRETCRLGVAEIADILDRPTSRVQLMLADARTAALESIGDPPTMCGQQSWEAMSALFDDTPIDAQAPPQEHVAFCADCTRTWHALDRLRTVMISLAVESGRASRVAKSVVRAMPSPVRNRAFLATLCVLLMAAGVLYWQYRGPSPRPAVTPASVVANEGQPGPEPLANTEPLPVGGPQPDGESSEQKPLTEAQNRGVPGVWRLEDAEGATVGEYIVVEDNGAFLMYGERREEQLENLVVHGVLTGIHLRVDDGVPFSALGGLEGSLSEDGNILPLSKPGEAKPRYRLVRIQGDKTSFEQTLERCMAAFAEMMVPLERYAADHHGAYPEKLEHLVPEYATDLSLYAEDTHKGVKYLGGVASLSVAGSLPAWKNTSPALPLAERLMRGEQFMRERFGNTPLDPVVALRVGFRDDCIECRATVLGSECGAVPCEARSGMPPPVQNIEGFRIECQDNLRRLWMAIQAFRDAHDGLTPPGWWTAYPDYLTDVNVLTSPKDEPGTDSYLLVLPAHNPDDITVPAENEGELVAVNPWLVPLLINRTDFPGSPGVRNVLFADGHVESIAPNSDEWRDRIAPFLALSEETPAE